VEGARIDRGDSRSAREQTSQPGEQAYQRQPGEGGGAAAAMPQGGERRDRERRRAERRQRRARLGDRGKPQPDGQPGQGREAPLPRSAGPLQG
jgi:hypothetical protein